MSSPIRRFIIKSPDLEWRFIMTISEDLIELLVCPVCRARVAPTAGGGGLECTGCGRVYPIRDAIPVMLADESEIADSGGNSE
jgi:uncharacterized protein YbaR (Trm112 family)